MRTLFAIILLFTSSIISAQFSDDFSDGDFTQNPTWIGDVDSFIVNTSNQLQLNANGEAYSYLSTANTQIDNTQWEFKVKISFSPSGNNNVSIFLVSDNTDLTQSLNGYLIKIGESGSDDGVDLYRKDGAAETKLIDGTAGTAASGGEFTIKVIRDNTGNWELYTNDILEGTVNDNTHTSTNFFGVYCKYTPSYSTKFYFDNFYVGNIIVDTIAPQLENLEIISQNQLKLTFSENLETTSANNINNYSINNGIGNPSSINFNQDIVELTFAQNFTSGQLNTLSLNNISDIEGNILSNYNTTFTYIAINENDIVINEIMADPSDSIQLPNFEFIELYNTTNYTLNLSGWKLQVGTSTKDMNDFTLAPNGYIIICKETAEYAFTQYGDVVTTTSSFTLTNGGTSITLIDENDQTINTVTYTDSWYNDATKAEGGWTLERIDPANNCSGSLNWTASNNPAGGTPGAQNSVYANNVDNTKPYVTNAILSSNNSIAIEFNEEIVNTSIINSTNYSVAGNTISNITIISENKIDLTLDNLFASGSQITLQISNLDDYCGNIMNDTTINFTYYKAEQFDIVINEIMADPSPVVYLPEAEYIELYNTSDFEISMHNWTLYYGNYSNTIPDINIPADSFVVLCKEIDLPLFENYNNVYTISSFNLSANGMLLAIADEENNIIHSVNYDISWYKDDNKTDGGWSLEQIDPTNPCGAYDNWHASTSNTGGTPNAINSVNEPNSDNAIPELINAYISDTNSIILTLSETIIIDTINANIFSVDNGIGNAVSISSETANNTIIKLYFNVNFEENIIYTLSLNSTIADCAGNITDITKTVKFGLSTRPQPNDIVINEVLFNPLDDGVDYVELYNHSNNIIDVSELKIATIKDGILDNIKIISIDPFLIFPKDYILISKDSRIVKQQYTTKTKYNFINVSSMPTYSNDEGTVVIVDNANVFIDEFAYNEEMHFPTLVTNDGVSLERINPDSPTNLSTNWHSAAETVGFGTPGYENSQYNPESNGTGTVSLEKDVFSPDNDGYEDILSINYNMEKSGYTANAYIFDANGRLMKQIVNNELLAISGSFNWDGIDNYNQKVKIGMYILVFEVFDMQGNTNKYKLPFVVAGRIE